MRVHVCVMLSSSLCLGTYTQSRTISTPVEQPVAQRKCIKKFNFSHSMQKKEIKNQVDKFKTSEKVYN